MRIATAFLITLASFNAISADDLPPGVVDTQNPGDISLSPQESLARITVPDGFKVTLFAGEPALRRPIAFDFDERRSFDLLLREPEPRGYLRSLRPA